MQEQFYGFVDAAQAPRVLATVANVEAPEWFDE